MDQKLERILQKVQKPARYTGGEYRQAVKDKNAADVRIAYCFPDTYEIGMSNLGLHIMYGVFNSIEGVYCERAFAPWGDMESLMRENGVELYGLESGDRLRDFDVIAFSLAYELSYTTVLNMLDLAGLPVRSGLRSGDAPLVIAGGACCFNPEPLAGFIDLFVIGEGEEVAVELVETIRAARRAGCARGELLERASALDGVYAPSLYDVSYHDDGTISGISARGGVALPVRKRIVKDLDSSYFPVEPIVPSTALVHDRAAIELFRGCYRGCRFCQAGHTGRPVRTRSPEKLIEQGIASLAGSGYDELALLSLSTSDYKEIIKLCDGLQSWCEPRNIGLSLPSLRADGFSIELMSRVRKVRKSGLTFAPEAGTQRLRDVINKDVTEDGLLETCRVAFEGGWNGVKLYFMLGLPTETDEDVVAIAELSHKVADVWKRSAASKKRGLRLTVSTSCFVPKPHTPFQREAQIGMDEYLRRVQLLRSSLRAGAAAYNWHAPEQGFVEAALARGDRRLGGVVESAWKLGAKLEAWSENFSLGKWLEAFEANGLDPGFYANREHGGDEILPWSVVTAAVSK